MHRLKDSVWCVDIDTHVVTLAVHNIGNSPLSIDWQSARLIDERKATHPVSVYASDEHDRRRDTFELRIPTSEGECRFVLGLKRLTESY